jgi:ABC-type transport system substrate-binding protein
MQKKPAKFCFGLIMCLALIFPLLLQEQASGDNTQNLGPRIDVLSYKFLPTLGYDKEQQALVNGQADMIPAVGSFEEAQNLTANSNVTVYKSPEGSTTLSCIFFNMRRNPCNDSVVRRAIASVVDRAYVCNTMLNGWVNQATTFVSPISASWTNLNAQAPAFDTQNARRILDNAGYTLNSLGWRKLPNSNTTMHTLAILTPTWTNSPILWDIGYMISYYANATGIPTQQIALADALLFNRTVQYRDFDLCITDVTLSQAPFGLYTILHSSRDQSGTFAYSGIHNSTLDSALEQLWFGTTKSTVQTAAINAQTFVSQLLPYVPVCSIPEISAVRSNWAGVVNMPGLGADNIWTILGVHNGSSSFGGTFVRTILGNLSTLNPCTATRVNEWNIIRQVFSPLFEIDPATIEETPMLANSWAVASWTTPSGTSGMKVTFNLRQNVVWQDNVPFTSTDVKFCIDYLKANNVPAFSSICNKILSVNAPNPSTVEIMLNDTGYRYLYDLAWFTFLPEHIWKTVGNYATFQPWREANLLASGLTKLVGQGPFMLSQCDLNSTVTLVWNPLFFLKNPSKPGLIQKVVVPQTATLGDNLDFRYTVCNHTGSSLSISNGGFTLSINRTDGTPVLTQAAMYRNGYYEISVNTTALSQGNYTCTFVALPYGVEASTLVLTQTPVIPELPPAFVVLLVLVLLIVVVGFPKRNRLYEKHEKAEAVSERTAISSGLV